MKRCFLLLMTLLLLFLSACGKDPAAEDITKLPSPPEITEEPIPEPAPAPADPRELWEKAAAVAKAYDNMEYEDRSTLSFRLFQDDEVLRQTTMFRGKDMNSMQMQLEAVTTGDNPRAYYYTDSTYYEDNGISRRACAMTTEDFWAYRREESMPFEPKYFASVELISEEGGWEKKKS